MISGLSYVIPVRWSSDATMREDLTAYLRELSGWCEDVLVIDGSTADVFSANAAAWGPYARHGRPDPALRCLNGKVAGVLTGIALARFERVVLADDDVRYDRDALARTCALLDQHELVQPQNYFSPAPWHAQWDMARSLLNRAFGRDFPGTLAVRRSFVAATGGYDGDVLFENLQLIRTVQAHGGRTTAPADLFVRRVPPTAGHFLSQRVRQAYDDFAIPPRMGLWLSIVPAILLVASRRRVAPVGLSAALVILVAEAGRRRGRGTAVFPASSTLLAPAWILERAVCSWLAVVERARFGGMRYAGETIKRAAHSRSFLRARARVGGSTGTDCGAGGVPTRGAGGGDAPQCSSRAAS